MAFNKLSRKSQLNCICNHLAKQCLSEEAIEWKGGSQLFPLEPIRIFIGAAKLSSETGPLLRFHTHRQLSRSLFHQRQILSCDEFKEVNWEAVHRTLHLVPRLFQVWVAKHVMGIAGTMKFLAHQDRRNPICPSCCACDETCTHIARCPKAGRTEAFLLAAAELSWWMRDNKTHPDFALVISKYVQG